MGEGSKIIVAQAKAELEEDQRKKRIIRAKHLLGQIKVTKEIIKDLETQLEQV